MNPQYLHQARNSLILILFLAPLLIMLLVTDLFESKSILGMMIIFPIVIFTPLQLYLNWRRLRLGRILVDQYRLRVDHGLPSFLGGKFDLSWNEISRISIITRFGTVYFYKYTSSRPLALRLTDWIPVDQKEAPPLSDLRATPLWATLQSIDAFRAHLENQRS